MAFNGFFDKLYKVKVKTIIILLITAACLGANASDKTFIPLIGNDFSNALNWNLLALPLVNDNIQINGTCSYDNLALNLQYGSLDIGYSQAGILTWPSGGTNTIRINNLSSSTAGSSLDMTNGGILQINGSWTSTNMTFTPGSGSVIITSGITIPSDVTTFNNLTINASGQTVSLSGNTTISGNLTLTDGNLSIGAYTLTINGDINISGGNLVGGSSTNLVIDGNSSITSLPSIVLNNLTIERANGVALAGDVEVNGTLTLTNGKITLGSNNLTIGYSGNISGASSSTYIITNGTGSLIRNGVGSSTVSFPVGTSSSYNPVTVKNDGTADNFSVKVKSTFDNPPLDPQRVVNRQWTINEATAGGSQAVVSLQFNSGEGASLFSVTDPVNVGRWNGSQWVGYLASLTGGGPYTVTTNEYITSFSPFGIGNEGSLPVELAYFNASTSLNNVSLNWGTTQEINNRGFEIQRKAADKEWMNVIFIDGFGTTNEPKHYSYTDGKLNTGKYQYRLKQIDYNGNYQYFNLTSPSQVSIGSPKQFAVYQNYPNPSNPRSKIDYEIPAGGKVTIKIYDITGSEVSVLVDETKDAGYYTADFDGTNFSSGIYFYRILSSINGTAFSKTMKLVLVK